MFYHDDMAKKVAKHVIYKDDKWVIKDQDRPLDDSATSYETQREAVKAARELAKANKVDLVIHARDGRILDIDSYKRRYTIADLLPHYQ